MSTEGSINEPGKSRQSFTPQSINEPPQLPDMPAPVISSIDPEGCVIGDPDFTLEVHGENFFAGTVIFFAGHDEPTSYDEAAGTVSTGVKPSLWGVPVVVQCQVHNGEMMSNAVDFTFNAAGTVVMASHTQSSERQQFDPDDLEEEIDAAADDDDFKPTHRSKPAAPHHKVRR
jgi:hypothetical protein